jgi:hypothetical protein
MYVVADMLLNIPLMSCLHSLAYDLSFVSLYLYNL